MGRLTEKHFEISKLALMSSTGKISLLRGIVLLDKEWVNNLLTKCQNGFFYVVSTTVSYRKIVPP